MSTNSNQNSIHTPIPEFPENRSTNRSELAAAFEPPDDDVEYSETAPLYSSARASIEGEEAFYQHLSTPDPGNDSGHVRSSNDRIPSTSSNHADGHHVDSVFSNLSAKPTVESNTEELEEEPPSYEQAAADTAPPYWDTTMVIPDYGSNEIYIDGMSVGTGFSFVRSACVAILFPFVGFLVTYVLSTTHLGRYGAQIGLSLTLFQRGYIMISESGMENNDDQYNYDELPHQKLIGSILVIIGWCLVLVDTFGFIRKRRMKNAISRTDSPGETSPEEVVLLAMVPGLINIFYPYDVPDYAGYPYDVPDYAGSYPYDVPDYAAQC